MRSLPQDLRYALRQVARRPGFAVLVIVIMGLGIGATTTVFSVANALMLRPLPFPDPDRLLVLWQDQRERGGPAEEWWTMPDFRDLTERVGSLEAAAFSGWMPTLGGEGEPEAVAGMRVTPAFFRVLGVAPALGRDFSPDEAPGADARVVLISHGLWERRYAADPAVVGSTIALSDEPFTVIGVMPRDLRIPDRPEVGVWRPLELSPGCAASRNCYVLQVISRLRDGHGAGAAAAELAAFSARLREENPDSKAGVEIAAVPLHRQLIGPLRPALLVLAGAVGVLLLLACVNSANLLLARAADRRGEIALRTALGARRGRLARQLVTEGLVLALLGGAAGALLAYWAVPVLASLLPPGTPLVDRIAVDVRVLGFALLVSVATGLAFGLAPALHAARADLRGALDQGGRMGAGGLDRMRGVLVAAQLAIAVVLLVTAGLFGQSFLRLQSVDPGFDAAGVLAGYVVPPATRYGDDAAIRRFYDEVLARIEADPRVIAAGATSILPMSGSNTDVSFVIEGRPPPAVAERPPIAWYRLVTPDYFRTVGMRVVRGRGITAADAAGAPQVVVVNETMARRFWPDEDPIGRRISPYGPEGPWSTVVGIAADVRHEGLASEPLIEMFVPVAQETNRAMFIVLRSAVEPLALLPGLRSALHEVDPQVPLRDARPLADLVNESLLVPRMFLALFAVFAAVALVLAAAGVYGLTAYAVARRTPEIGLRMALGADGASVLRLVVGRAALLVAGGLAAGIAAALLSTRAAATVLFEVSATDPSTFGVVVPVLVLVALAAAYVPARRAARVDPMTALRTE